MAEVKQETEKKKRGLFRRIVLILKWIGLILLGILLIAALVFQAPWKVIALLVIILLACIILPKPYRKWFWASVGVVVIVLVIWVFLPDDNEGWQPYTFDEELAAIEAERAVPDEENAAVIYNQLFETPILDGNEPEFFVQATPSSKSEPWLTKDHPETKEWLDGHQSTIAKLLEASQQEKCWFPIDTIVSVERIDRLPAMRHLSCLLVSAGNNDIAEGRIDSALEKYLCVIQMSQHLYQQPTMLDFLVGVAIEDMATEELNRFLIEAQPTLKQLQLISASFKNLKNNFSSKLISDLEYDKLYSKMLCCIYYEINKSGKTRLSRNPAAAIQTQFKQEIPVPTYWQGKVFKAWILWAWFYMPSTPQKVSRLIDDSYERFYAMARPGFEWTEQPEEWLSVVSTINFLKVDFNYRYFVKTTADMSESSYYGFHRIYLKWLTLRRGSRLLVAIRRYQLEHGSWPETLDRIKSTVPPEALIDPVTDEQLQYENHGERFSLYGEKANIWPK